MTEKVFCTLLCMLLIVPLAQISLAATEQTTLTIEYPISYGEENSEIYMLPKNMGEVDAINFETGYRMYPLSSYGNFIILKFSWKDTLEVLAPYNEHYNGSCILKTKPASYGTFLICSFAEADNAERVESTALIHVEGNDIEIIPL